MSIPTASNILLYGKGVFTTIAICDGKPILWDKHWRRLNKDLEAIGLDFPSLSENDVLEHLTTTVENKSVENGRARITLFDETPSSIWQASGEQKSSVQILIGDLRRAPEDLHLTVSPFPQNSRSPLTGVKSCNYLENIITIGEAKRRGFDEATRLNERGEVTSACMANVFWLRNDVLYTPSLKTGCLPGTTREFVLENLDCREVEAGIEELEMAEAIFLTSAGLGIVEVSEFSSKKLERSGHSIMGLWPPPS